jgi:hypothetical protein
MSMVYYDSNFKGFGARVEIIRLYSNFVYIIFIHIGTSLEASTINNNNKKKIPINKNHPTVYIYILIVI